MPQATATHDYKLAAICYLLISLDNIFGSQAISIYCFNSDNCGSNSVIKTSLQQLMSCKDGDVMVLISSSPDLMSRVATMPQSGAQPGKGNVKQFDLIPVLD